jgi:hypothetical protein
LGDDQNVDSKGCLPMRFTQSLPLVVLVMMTVAAPSYAGGVIRVGGSNPNTGNAGVLRAGYHSETGARYVRAGGYNAATGTYTGGTRAYNPTTGQGFTTTTTAAQGSGITTTINTLNKGSYTCTVSQTIPGHCVELDNLDD